MTTPERGADAPEWQPIHEKETALEPELRWLPPHEGLISDDFSDRQFIRGSSDATRLSAEVQPTSENWIRLLDHRSDESLMRDFPEFLRASAPQELMFI